MMQHNLLVISDLHLGEDLRLGERNAQLDALEAELCEFLHHYAADSGRWRLVINGDMVDFMAVCLRPEDVGNVAGWNEDVHYYGLGSASVASGLKMWAVIRRHESFFEALAAFVSGGNDIVVVAGNHDREFHWPKVQAAFREGIRPYLTMSRDLEEAVVFQDWFYYEPGTVWVEHGNQYDAYCSYETVLDPVDPAAPGHLEENLDIASMRYVGNNLPGNPEERSDMSFLDYIKMTFERDADFATMVLGGYWMMIRKLFSQYLARVFSPGLYQERFERHQERLRELASKTGVASEILNRLAASRRKPLFLDLAPMIHGLMLGRLFLSLAILSLVPLAVALLPWAVLPWALIVLGGGLAVGHAVLAGQREVVDPTEEMVRSASRIRQMVRAPFVVFGHSHHALARRIEDGWYFNTGTWVGDADQVRVFTHLLIRRGQDGVQAALCRWRNGQSRELRSESA